MGPRGLLTGFGVFTVEEGASARGGRDTHREAADQRRNQARFDILGRSNFYMKHFSGIF